MTLMFPLFFGWHIKKGSLLIKEITQITTIAQKIKISFPNGTELMLRKF
jgi:hypothetical protein